MHDKVTDSGMLARSYGAAAAGNAAILPLTASRLHYAVSGKRLVDIEALELAAGGPTLVMGPNGAGKSLMLRLLHGLIVPSGGEVLFGGRPMNLYIRRRQAMVFQRPVVLRRSVRANIDYALAAQGVGRRERAGRVDELLRMGELAGKARQPARTLSSGEQQRLALVRAIAAEPELLFLDEPTSSLDPAATQMIEALIQSAVAGGTKIVMVTHDIGQARRLGGEILFMHRGKVVEQTPCQTFIEAPVSHAARAFLAGQLLL